MRRHKRHHLTANLLIRHVAVQINPIHALHIEHHMPIEHIIHRHRGSHHHSLTATERPHQTPAWAVRGEASLVVKELNCSGNEFAVVLEDSAVSGVGVDDELGACDPAVHIFGEDRRDHAVVVAVGDQCRLGDPRQVGGCGASPPFDRLQLSLEGLDADVFRPCPRCVLSAVRRMRARRACRRHRG